MTRWCYVVAAVVIILFYYYKKSTQIVTDHRPRFSHRRDSNSTATRSWASTDFNTSPTLTANSSSPPRISLHIAFYTHEHHDNHKSHNFRGSWRTLSYTVSQITKVPWVMSSILSVCSFQILSYGVSSTQWITETMFGKVNCSGRIKWQSSAQRLQIVHTVSGLKVAAEVGWYGRLLDICYLVKVTSRISTHWMPSLTPNPQCQSSLGQVNTELKTNRKKHHKELTETDQLLLPSNQGRIDGPRSLWSEG